MIRAYKVAMLVLLTAMVSGHVHQEQQQQKQNRETRAVYSSAASPSASAFWGLTEASTGVRDQAAGHVLVWWRVRRVRRAAVPHASPLHDSQMSPIQRG